MNWTSEYNKLLVVKVFKAVKRGLPMDIGFEWTAKKLEEAGFSEMNIVKVRNHWYGKLHNKYSEKLKFYKQGVSVQKSNGGQWSKKDDQKVIMVVKEHMVTGQQLEQLFLQLGDALDRTQKAVSMRWYNVLKKDKEIMRHMNEFEQAIKEMAS